MGIIGDAFSSLNQSIMIMLSFIGVIVAVGSLFYAIATSCSSTVAVVSYIYFTLFCCKNIYDYGYGLAKLHKEVTRLDNETDQLEESVDSLGEERIKYTRENDRLNTSVTQLKKVRAKLQSNVDSLNTENDKLTLSVSQLRGSVTNLKSSVSSLDETNKSLIQERDKLHTITSQQRIQLDVSANQIDDLSRLLENSKKMVTNLILAGDDYKKFNNKFGTSLATLGETSSDLRKHTELLGKIANSLAKQVPDNRIKDVQIDRTCVNGNLKKISKLDQIELKKNAAIIATS